MDALTLLVLSGVGGAIVLVLCATCVYCCCFRDPDDKRSCTCCTCRCTHPRYEGPVVDSGVQRIVYPSTTPSIQQHLVNAHPKFWQSLTPTPLHDGDKSRHSSCSSDNSPISQPLKTSFDFSLCTTYQTENVTLTAISIRNLRCTSPKVIVKAIVLEALQCCPDEGEELSRRRAELSGKGAELNEDGEEPRKKRTVSSETETDVSDSGFDHDQDTCSVDLSSQTLKPDSINTINTQNLGVSPDSSLSISPQHVANTDFIKSAADSMSCHRCKRPYTLITATRFETRSMSFRSDLSINESHTFRSASGGPFWVEVTVVEKEDPSVVICKGRSEDLYRQNLSFKTFYLETVKKDTRGSVLFGLKYLPLTGKMTLALIESKDLEALDYDSAVDIYLKASLLFRGTSCLRARSHGSAPSPIHDNIALWMDHFVHFDIPPDQLDKVTIVAEIIVKSRAGEGPGDSGGGVGDGKEETQSPTKITVPAILIDTDKEKPEMNQNETKIQMEEGRIVRKKVGRVILGKDASSEDGRRQWNEAVESSRQEVLYWHKLY